MAKLKTVLWMLIRKESEFDQIDWASVITLALYGGLFMLLGCGLVLTALFFEWPPHGR